MGKRWALNIQIDILEEEISEFEPNLIEII
jgi:hypothetical protein